MIIGYQYIIINFDTHCMGEGYSTLSVCLFRKHRQYDRLRGSQKLLYEQHDGYTLQCISM